MPQGPAPQGPAPQGPASRWSAPSLRERIGGLIRLLHPFPSLLNSVATVAIATLAGADAPTAGRLGLSMFAMQASIGALNDLVDAPLDAGQKPGKPVPRGLVSSRVAGAVALVTAVAGLVLSAPSGWGTLLAACGVLALGYVYDLRLSRTSLSWLPLALALPVLPIHAWLGATGGLPAGLVPLLPVAVVAGLGLAVGNALADLERDAATGRRGIAVALGRERAWLAHGAALGVAAAAAAAAVALGPPSVPPNVAPADVPMLAGALAAVRTIGLPAGVGALALGIALMRAGSPTVRERAWELEAVGVAAIGVAWIVRVAETG